MLLLKLMIKLQFMELGKSGIMEVMKYVAGIAERLRVFRIAQHRVGNICFGND